MKILGLKQLTKEEIKKRGTIYITERKTNSSLFGVGG